MNAIEKLSTTKNIKTARFNLRYYEAGQGETLIMTHSGGPGASSWATNRWVFGTFSERYRTILIDLPGFGGSSYILPKQPRDFINSQGICELMDAIGIARANIIGGPMGASIVRFATEHPSRLNKLIMVSPAALASSIFSPRPNEGIKAESDFYKNPSRWMTEAFLKLSVYDQALITEEVIDDRYSDISENPEHISNFLKSSGSVGARLSNVQELVSSIKQDTLLVWGRDDRFVPLDNALNILWRLPSSQLHVFGECGHWPQYEKANEFTELVFSFLK